MEDEFSILFVGHPDFPPGHFLFVFEDYYNVLINWKMT